MELLAKCAAHILMAIFYSGVVFLSLLVLAFALSELRRIIRKRKRRKTPNKPEEPKPAYPPMDLRLKE